MDVDKIILKLSPDLEIPDEATRKIVENWYKSDKRYKSNEEGLTIIPNAGKFWNLQSTCETKEGITTAIITYGSLEKIMIVPDKVLTTGQLLNWFEERFDLVHDYWYHNMGDNSDKLNFTEWKYSRLVLNEILVQSSPQARKFINGNPWFKRLKDGTDYEMIHTKYNTIEDLSKVVDIFTTENYWNELLPYAELW